MKTKLFQSSQLLFWFLIFNGLLQALSQPMSNLYWSMEEIDGVDLYPTIGNRSVWKAQLNVSDFRAVLFNNFTSNDSAEIVDGLKGNALLVDNFNMKVGIPFNTGCLFDLAQCGTTGLTVAMWMFVRRWTNKTAFMFGSSDWVINGPGISLYEDPRDEISFKATVILLNGSLYEAAFSRDLIGQRWSHVAMTWSFKNGVKLFVNGSEVPSYTQEPVHESRNNVIATVPHLAFGAEEADVILDEIGVWYQELSGDDIFLTSCPPNATSTTRPALTTTSDTPTETLPNQTLISPSLFSWRTETIIALSLGVAISLSAFIISVCVFCCLLAGKRRRKRKKSKREEIKTIR